MSLLNSLNDWSEVLLGVGILDLWKQASQSKTAAQKAEKLAQDKHLREASQIVEKTLGMWSPRPGFWERLIRRWLVNNLLKQLKQQLEQWRERLADADKLTVKAKALVSKDTGNPLQTQALSEAIALYNRSAEITYDENVLRAISQCKQELQRRQQFQNLVKEAEAQAEKRYFKLALPRFREAEQLYSTEPVRRAIANCSAQIKHEDGFLDAMKVAQQAFKEGKLRGAIALLESTLTNFPRSDGIELLEQLKRTVKGKEKFRQGLNAEQLGAFRGAASMYEEAKVLLLDPTDCQIRLGQVAVKTKEWATAISYLEGVRGEQAAYLRGFAQAQQGNLQQAHREWQSLTHTATGYQRDALKILAQRQRLQALKNIEQSVKDERLEAAKTQSEEFIKKFGSEPVVQGNLDEHIQPRIEAAVWQSSDWGTIADTLEQVLIKQLDVKSLHNWAVAIYYYALAEPQETRDFASLEDLIIALSAALANLHQDPALQNLPWLGNTPVDYNSVFSDLQRRIEEAIDSYKDRDNNVYLKLRDRYRLETVALRLMGNPPTKGLRVKGVFITPGCYEIHKENLKITTFPAQLWGALYTAWGLAVAACVEGNTQRALQLKPLNKPTDEAESFAQNFVAYHEGCYLLQQQKWREAMNPLKQAKKEIETTTAWQQEVDRLCGLQRQAISEFREHLEFAQFWYDLLDSQPARSYLAEYKAEQIRDKLAKEQISLKQVAQELQKVEQIDDNNPVVLDLIDRVEMLHELETIQQLYSNRQYEEMVGRAKRSRHELVRYTVAEFIIERLINAVNSGNLNDPEARRQLGRWAYEICPNEPAFQEVYRQLGLRY